MRTLVHPPPTLHCDFCHGELRLKRIEPCGLVTELDTEIFVCVKCGHEKLHMVRHDPYIARHTASSRPPPR